MSYNNYPEFENNRIKGVVYSFDGAAGVIITNTNEYVFRKDDLVSTDINKGDAVEFLSNKIPYGDETLYVAREVTNQKDIDQTKKTRNG